MKEMDVPVRTRCLEKQRRRLHVADLADEEVALPRSIRATSFTCDRDGSGSTIR